MQALVVVVVVRPMEGGAPEEPAVEAGEKLMFAEKIEDGGRRGSYIFAGETPGLMSRKDESLTIGGGREPGEVCALVSVRGGCCGIACGGLP